MVRYQNLSPLIGCSIPCWNNGRNILFHAFLLPNVANLSDSVSVRRSIRPLMVRPSTSRSVGPSICPYITLFDRLPLNFESTRRGDERRNRPAARDRKTIIDPRRHPRHSTRFGIEATANWNRNNINPKNTDVILDALAPFSMHWRHSHCAGAILDALAPFSMPWCHS